MTATRRLAAILAADVAGYSRLIGADEEGTLNRLRSIRAQVIDPKIAEHRGRLVKTTGDGLLIEFASVVDALRSATEIQREMGQRNLDTVEAERIDFRIGVHQGDIVVDAGDILGDGVNIAARLEGLAEPGGICVSARVQEDAAGKLDLVFRDLGEQQLKNIARQVRAYAIDRGTVPRPVPSMATVPRLSIVVLPFANLSNDPEAQYFADGITEDLTTDLSRLASMFVISRNTAFTYRSKSVDTKKIGRELGVRYVLEGSVRRSGNQIRVSVQLIDAETDAHLWAERFDHDTGDIFTLQDEVTNRIAVALNIAVIGAEAARSNDQPDALDYILRGRAAAAKGPARENTDQALNLFERALALDPASVEAKRRLAATLVTRVTIGMTDSAAADVARADKLISQVLVASPRDWFAHWVKAQVLRTHRRCEDAIPEYETALALNPNGVIALTGLSWCKLYGGSIEEIIPLQERAIRLSPRDPNIGFWYGTIGFVHLLQSRLDEAIFWLEKARSANQGLAHYYLISAYALRGDTERAAAELAEARRLDTEHLPSISRAKAIHYLGVPKIRALFENTYLAGLRKAGMPEE